MTCFPVEEKKKERGPTNLAVLRMLFVLGSIFFISVTVLNPAGAEVNWTNITIMANGIAGVIPAISNIITAIIEPILLLVFVGFFVGLFDGLLSGIQNAFRFGRY